MTKRNDGPATFGGAGWTGRRESHRDEVAAGRLWRSCGVPFEAAPLREVVLARPVPAMAYEGPPDSQLMLERPEIPRLAEQARELGACYREEGVHVCWADGGPDPSPNFIFQRDLFLITADGAIVGRPAAPQRAAEARFAAASLASLGVPILATSHGEMTFEGADALWLAPDTVLVGVGVRTNAAGFAFVRDVLRELGVDAHAVPLPAGVQHLLGVLNFFERGRAALRPEGISDRFLATLRDLSVETLTWEVDEPWGMNFVAVDSGRVIMPAGRPRSRRRLEEAGVAVRIVDVGEYLKAAGGVGCATGILHRVAPDGATP